MDIIDAMDVQIWITFIYNFVGEYMFRKRCKANQQTLFILKNIERRDLVLGHLRGLRFVEAIYPFLLEKQSESKIR